MIGVRDVMARKHIKIGRGVKRKHRASPAVIPNAERNLELEIRREAAADTKRSLVTPFLLGMTKGLPATEKQCG
jgi:hypothetical protein